MLGQPVVAGDAIIHAFGDGLGIDFPHESDSLKVVVGPAMDASPIARAAWL